ncbi:hypothetical protein D6774_00385 [Candidatus Woesearchaeota archaeon]|nr:MAG: hypothetical protein D6774_00385 [Candidatus Woesearchaeota archaeon]
MNIQQTTKAQAQQIFIFILAMLITAGIIVYGYTAIKDFTQRQEEVEALTLQKQLENEFEILLSDFGTIKRPEIRVPEKFDFVCFSDGFKAKDDNADICNSGNDAYSPVACSAYKNDQANVFFIPDGSKNFMVIDNKIQINSGSVLCVPVRRGRINLQLESKGDRILASTYS